jgi:hypothetical protein
MIFRFVFACLLLFLAGIPLANACEDVDKSTSTEYRTSTQEGDSAAIAKSTFSREHDSHRCDCPCPVTGAAAPLMEWEKARICATASYRCDVALAILSAVDDRRARVLSVAEAREDLPVYLLTARLRR